MPLVREEVTQFVSQRIDPGRIRNQDGIAHMWIKSTGTRHLIGLPALPTYTGST